MITIHLGKKKFNIHRYRANTSRYDFIIKDKPVTFKCICGKEIKSPIRFFFWKTGWFIKDGIWALKN